VQLAAAANALISRVLLSTLPGEEKLALSQGLTEILQLLLAP